MPQQQGYYNQNNAGHRGEWGRERGGMVNENFAKGGPVKNKQVASGSTAKRQLPDRDKRFNELLAIESRGFGDQGGGTTARDRAARRLSAEEGRPSSTAYSPGQARNKFPPAPKTGQPRENVPIPTPRPDVTGEPKGPPGRLVGPDDRAPYPKTGEPANPIVKLDRFGHVVRESDAAAIKKTYGVPAPSYGRFGGTSGGTGADPDVTSSRRMMLQKLQRKLQRKYRR